MVPYTFLDVEKPSVIHVHGLTAVPIRSIFAGRVGMRMYLWADKDVSNPLWG